MFFPRLCGVLILFLSFSRFLCASAGLIGLNGIDAGGGIVYEVRQGPSFCILCGLGIEFQSHTDGTGDKTKDKHLKPKENTFKCLSSCELLM